MEAGNVIENSLPVVFRDACRWIMISLNIPCFHFALTENSLNGVNGLDSPEFMRYSILPYLLLISNYLEKNRQIHLVKSIDRALKSQHRKIVFERKRRKSHVSLVSRLIG